MSDYDYKAIDAVVNIWNEEALRQRPGWGDDFFQKKMKSMAGREPILLAESDQDLAEKINALLDVDLKAFGAHSRQLVENNFAWPQIARKTLSAYETVL